MIVIPAIDLHHGKVVRLKKGDFNAVTIYSDSVASIASSFEEAGARRIHVVDLDGSLEGRRINADSIKAICDAVNVEVELGGGIRTLADADEAFRLCDLWHFHTLEPRKHVCFPYILGCMQQERNV